MMTEREARKVAERAYRRGYSQGVHIAVQALLQSKDLLHGKDLQHWADECLEWRSAHDTKYPKKWAATGCFPPQVEESL